MTTEVLIVDPDAYYNGPDLKGCILNAADSGLPHYRIPVELLKNKKDRQQYAERWLLLQHGMIKGMHYHSATINDEGQIVYYPYELVFEMELP
jgi:hypothetical protein